MGKSLCIGQNSPQDSCHTSPTIDHAHKDAKMLPCSMPMILRLDLLQNSWQVFTCVEYAHNFKAKKFTRFMAKYYPVVCP